MATDTTPAAEQLAHEWTRLMAHIGGAQITLAEVERRILVRKCAMYSIGETQAHLELALDSFRLLNEAGFIKALGG